MDQYLIYLRKSRKDRDAELETGVFDTLQRHRDALLALARRQHYSISGVFEEVVSGDTIAERPEMQKLLSAVETGRYAGVLVMEVPRLARGNTRDQGTVAETFKYSNTKIITPDKIYDPSDEADEEYFEFGLFMSRREYMAINRRLQRGRMASLNEGKYIAGAAPYGYRKVKLAHQKGYTLEIAPAQAEVVREIFRLYTVGDPRPDGATVPVGSYAIAESLNARAIPSPGGVKWSASGVRDILKNPTYAGFVRWSYRPETRQMVDGIVRVSYPVSKEPHLKRGLHPAIVSQEIWTAARAAMTGRSHVPVPGKKRIANPLAGLLYCSECGRPLVQLPHGSKSGAPMLLCPTPHCPTVGCLRSAAEKALMDSLSNWLKSYRVRAAESSAAGAEEPARRKLEQLRKNLETLTGQRDRLFDLLEQGVYSQAVFLQRSRVLTARMDDAEKAIRQAEKSVAALAEARLTREQLAPRIRNVLEVYDTLDDPADQNALLRSVVDHAVYHKTVRGKGSDLRLYVYPRVTPLKKL